MPFVLESSPRIQNYTLLDVVWTWSRIYTIDLEHITVGLKARIIAPMRRVSMY